MEVALTRGYTAAIYAARADLKPVVYTGMEPGGQLTTTTEVDNFPGYPNGVDGPAMMMELQQQAERFGTEVRIGHITEVISAKKKVEFILLLSIAPLLLKQKPSSFLQEQVQNTWAYPVNNAFVAVESLPVRSVTDFSIKGKKSPSLGLEILLQKKRPI